MNVSPKFVSALISPQMPQITFPTYLADDTRKKGEVALHEPDKKSWAPYCLPQPQPLPGWPAASIPAPWATGAGRRDRARSPTEGSPCRGRRASVGHGHRSRPARSAGPNHCNLSSTLTLEILHKLLAFPSPAKISQFPRRLPDCSLTQTSSCGLAHGCLGPSGLWSPKLHTPFWTWSGKCRGQGQCPPRSG